MASVTLTVGGRRYDLACREGEQAHLEALARIVDAKAQVAGAALGGINESRQLLLAALLLADEIDGHAQPASEAIAPDVADDLAPSIEALADRLEALVARLEKDRAHS